MTELHVSFRVGDADYVVPAAQVLHLESYTAATPVPGAPDFVAGIVQVRGRLVPIVDLRKRFGLAPVEHTLDHRIVVVQVGERVAGLLVDSAREVLKLDQDAYAPPPEIIEQQAHGFIRAVATVTKRVFLVVDVSRVIAQEAARE
ncbi:MAG TPA: chemotaxis protein CheW [Kofleriaceae bacterium]|jgi:purine-binding chemotaxis protein CheW